VAREDAEEPHAKDAKDAKGAKKKEDANQELFLAFFAPLAIFA